MQNRLFCASLLLTGFVLAAHAQVVLQAPHPIALHAGGGEVTFTLSVQDPKVKDPITLALAHGPIVDTATHTVIKGAAANLTASVEGASLPTSITPGQTLSITASVTGISGASEAEFPILNGVSQLGTLSAFASDAPLTVSIDGDGATPDKSLAYTYGDPVVVALKNGDAQSYHLHWIFEINNQPESFGDLYIPLSGSSRITFKPTSKPFSILDWIHPSNKKGVLLLSVISPTNDPASTNVASPPSVPDGLLPARSLSASLVMQPISPFWSGFWSYSYVVVLLLIGGLFSFLGSSMLPNMQKKGQLRSQLQDLANRTTTVSTSIDSYLRVLLRLERRRIAIIIDNAPSWIPASADPLVLAAASIDSLSKRLAGAERLDDLRRKHDLVCATAPPSVSDGIDANLQAAADQLHSIALSDTVLAAANGFFAKAQAALDMLDDTDALAKQIAGNVALVMTRLEKFPPNYYADLKDSLPGVFIIADPTRGFNDAKNIVRPMLFAIDHGAAAIQLALDYAMVRASVPVMPAIQARPPAPAAQPAGTPPVQAADAGLAALADAALAAPADAAPAVPADATLQCDNLWEIARQRLLKRHCVLLELLGTLSWRALRDATLLIQEMREDTYEEDVLDEIGKQGQAEIAFDTQKARPIQPVFFSIKFKNSRFNDAAALQRLMCHWIFPDDLDEYTWKVCHYFSGYEHGTTPPSEFKQAAPPQTGTSSTTSGSNQLANAPHKRRSLRLSTPPIKRDLDLYATIRGQQIDESREVPIPPLKKTIRIESAATTERSIFWAEVLRFAIAFAVALAGLLSGALEQLKKLDIIPASIAIIGLGFSASVIKNLLTQSAAPQTPAPAPTPATAQK
jgi:hypothetical protein